MSKNKHKIIQLNMNHSFHVAHTSRSMYRMGSQKDWTITGRWLLNLKKATLTPQKWSKMVKKHPPKSLLGAKKGQKRVKNGLPIYKRLKSENELFYSTFRNADEG